MSGLITDKDERAWNDKEIQFDYYSDNNHRQAFFHAHHQMLAYHQWLSFCPEEATLFHNTLYILLVIKTIYKFDWV
jgi:hypothetical protein